jgi:hypothetical protein
MIIQYVGKKDRITINSPIGVGNKKCKEKLHFAPNATHVFTNEEGELLLKLDSINFKEIEYVDEEKKEEETELLEPKKRGRPKRVIDDNIDNI